MHVYCIFVFARTVESILQVIRVLRPYWHCFAYQETATNDAQLPAFFKNIEIPKRLVNALAFHCLC